jgi:hypothetical protein
MSATDVLPSPATEQPVVPPINKTNPHIVILGGGFGGLNFAKSLHGSR